MSLSRALSAGLLACLFGCGGAQTPAPTPTEDPVALTEAAEAAWGELDPTRAAGLADRAVAAGGGTVALEIAARAHLALGDGDAARGALTSASSPHLRRLRARAHMTRGAFAEAAEELEDDDDPWAESVRPALLAVRGRDVYVTRGERAELPLEALPLPVVRVSIEGRQVLAVISTGADMTVLDPSVRANPGSIDTLGLGEIEVGAVPHTVRSLATLRDGLGVPVGALIGLDLLMRLHARIDGPASRLALSTTPWPALEDATAAAFVTPTGSFVALEGRLESHAVWLTLDTTGLYPIALVPGAEEALGLEAEWQPADGPGQAVLPVHVGVMVIEGMPVLRGLLDDEHARAVGAPVAGAIGWALLAQLVTRFEPERRRVLFE